MDIKKKLFEFRDEAYGEFNKKLIPTVDSEKVIGVRTPTLKSLAKSIKGSDTAVDFINTLPHEYFEENNLHAYLIAEINDFDECVKEIDRFLPYVDNWATCDGLKPRCFKKNPEKLILKIYEWIKCDEIYTVRFAIGTLMSFYLDENFETKYLELVSEIRSEEYYVNMMISWYFATALAKRYDSAVRFLEDKKLSVWCHNKTIQKSVESFRIPEERKRYLKNLKL